MDMGDAERLIKRRERSGLTGVTISFLANLGMSFEELQTIRYLKREPVLVYRNDAFNGSILYGYWVEKWIENIAEDERNRCGGAFPKRGIDRTLLVYRKLFALSPRRRRPIASIFAFGGAEAVWHYFNEVFGRKELQGAKNHEAGRADGG